MHIRHLHLKLREELPMKKHAKLWKISKINTSIIQNLEYFKMRGWGDLIFITCPNLNDWNIALTFMIYWWHWVIFQQNMVYIWLVYDCNSPVRHCQKCLTFSQFGSRWQSVSAFYNPGHYTQKLGIYTPFFWRTCQNSWAWFF